MRRIDTTDKIGSIYNEKINKNRSAKSEDKDEEKDTEWMTNHVWIRDQRKKENAQIEDIEANERGLNIEWERRRWWWWWWKKTMSKSKKIKRMNLCWSNIEEMKDKGEEWDRKGLTVNMPVIGWMCVRKSITIRRQRSLLISVSFSSEPSNIKDFQPHCHLFRHVYPMMMTLMLMTNPFLVLLLHRTRSSRSLSLVRVAEYHQSMLLLNHWYWFHSNLYSSMNSNRWSFLNFLDNDLNCHNHIVVVTSVGQTMSNDLNVRGLELQSDTCRLFQMHCMEMVELQAVLRNHRDPLDNNQNASKKKHSPPEDLTPMLQLSQGSELKAKKMPKRVMTRLFSPDRSLTFGWSRGIGFKSAKWTSS